MLLIDAANVIGSRPTGWWRDRSGAAEKFVAALRLAVRRGHLLNAVVVLEGDARGGVEEGVVDEVTVIHAPAGADDLLVQLASEDGARAVLISSDRALRKRVQDVGGRTLGPRWLLDRMQY